MVRLFSWLLGFVAPSIAGSSSGGGSAAREQRQLEEERQRRVNEGVARVNAIFSGGKYGTGPVAAPNLEWDREYYDQAGSPVRFTRPERILVRPEQFVPGERGGRRTQPAVYSQAPERPFAAGQGGFLGVMRPPTQQYYTGFGESEGYSDEYFDTIADAFMNYYRPQLDEQYGRARRNVILGSPSQGSGYLRNLGDLGTDYARESVALGERSQAARAESKRDVESNRAQLIRAAEAGSAPDVVAQQAVEASKFLRQPPAFEPLGDLFARSANAIANLKAAQRAGYETRDAPLFFNPGRKRSSAAVNVG